MCYWTVEVNLHMWTQFPHIYVLQWLHEARGRMTSRSTVGGQRVDGDVTSMGQKVTQTVMIWEGKECGEKRSQSSDSPGRM
jgi:hypothetical protein